MALDADWGTPWAGTPGMNQADHWGDEKKITRILPKWFWLQFGELLGLGKHSWEGSGGESPTRHSWDRRGAPGPRWNSLHTPLVYAHSHNTRILARGFSIKFERGVAGQRTLTTPNDINMRESH